jgi:hypothetical protein
MSPPLVPNPARIEMMALLIQGRVSNRTRLSLGLLLAFLSLLPACKRAEQSDTAALDQAGMWFNSVGELRTLNVSNAEIAELVKVRQAGLSDLSCINMIKLARSRKKPFTDGQAIADLLSAGSSEQTVLELAHLNQLGLWAGQARALRLVGLSDNVILAVARRRAQNLPVLSGETLGELKNAGASDAVIQDMVQKGVTEKEASYYIAQRQRAAGGHGFVYQGRGRRKR